MALARQPISAGAPGRAVCLRLLVAVLTLIVLPTQSRAMNARVRWAPSTDPRVAGYKVYLREATRPYGTPVDLGSALPEDDGAFAWMLTGLQPAGVYFVAVSAYTADQLESALSNELAIGAPDPCVQDVCTTPTQCTVQTLPDGTLCGSAAAAACGATCQ